MTRPTPAQIKAAGEKAMVDFRAEYGPSVNADIIDLAKQRRHNALYVLDILLRAYVPKQTNDWREVEDALAELRKATP